MNTLIDRNRTRVTATAVALAVATVATGCTREFFRNWADQDVAEAVFEKSRDPRWRIDQFTKEPPQFSRFGEAYDPDFPPSPPDDYAAEALSPRPQNPDHKVLSPEEGTGYLDRLEAFRRQREARGESIRPIDRELDSGPIVEEGVQIPPTVTPDANPFPINPRQPDDPLSPTLDNPLEEEAPGDPRRDNDNLLPGSADFGSSEPPMTPQSSSSARIQDPELRGELQTRDDGVQVVTFHQLDLGNQGDTGLTQDPSGETRLGEEETQVRSGTSLEELATSGVGSEAGEDGEGLIEKIRPRAIEFDEAFAAGYSEEINPYVIDAREALILALENSRAYQFALEDVYLVALALTLQRFNFTPQINAGLGPGGTFAGGFPTNPGNSYLYRTLETGNQTSTLALGSALGIGKFTSFGASIVGNVANSTVINFLGNSTSPVVTTSNSFLPLQIFIPFLQGGGRAVALENLTQAERNLLYQIRDFARFRKEFFVSILAGGPVSGGGPGDPSIGFLQLLSTLQTVEINAKTVEAFRRVEIVFNELAQGAASNVTPLDLSNVESNLRGAEFSFVTSANNYRSFLDSYKLQLGLPPDTPLILDTQGILSGFRDVFNEVEELDSQPRVVLERVVDKLPVLPEIEIEGRPVIASLRDAERLARRQSLVQARITERKLLIADIEDLRNDLSNPLIDDRQKLLIQQQLEQLLKLPLAQDPDTADAEDRAELSRLSEEERLALRQSVEDQEDLLISAERVALQNRLDLKNSRAELYDDWRQLAVTANGLQGVFNVSLTSEALTPPTTNNPAGFDSQTGEFSLTFNAELPLIRLAERNAFVGALITYQRSRRALMQIEDNIKLTIRNAIRDLKTGFQQYELSKASYIAQLIQLDQSFQRYLEPPRGAGADLAGNTVLQLTGSLNAVNTAQISLIGNWVGYQTDRLELYRDLGILPYDEWEAYYELFPSAKAAEVTVGGGLHTSAGASGGPTRLQPTLGGVGAVH